MTWRAVCEGPWMQGHGLDAALGLGTADDEFQLIGSTNNLRYLDGSSVGGSPGGIATAVAVLSDTVGNCTVSLRCYIKEVLITNPGQGYMYPPSVTFSGGGGSASSPAHGARATAIISGGTVLRVEAGCSLPSSSAGVKCPRLFVPSSSAIASREEDAASVYGYIGTP